MPRNATSPRAGSQVSTCLLGGVLGVPGCLALAFSCFPHPFFVSVLYFPHFSGYSMEKHIFFPVLFLECIESSFGSNFQLANRTLRRAARRQWGGT